jgi:hypothetical protein
VENDHDDVVGHHHFSIFLPSWQFHLLCYGA